MTLNEVELQYEFPWVFKNLSLECKPGWEKLIKDLCSDVEDIISDGILCGSWLESNSPKFTKIYLEYGRMKVDMINPCIEIQKRINKAQVQSSYTCEVCGNLGKIRSVKKLPLVRCDECFKQSILEDQ